LYVFGDGIPGGYSDLIATQLADASGNATFSNVVIPAVLAGTDRYFVVRHVVSVGEAFSDPFELLPAARSGGSGRLSLGVGLGL
jgi:hypothetical protein